MSAYYDHDPEVDSQFILAGNPTVEDDAIWFFSPQAPDPLEIDLETGVLYDIDSTTALGEVTNVFVPTSLSDPVVNSNAEAILRVATGETPGESLDIQDPRIREAVVESFDEDIFLIHVFSDNTVFTVDEEEFNPGDDYDAERPVTTLEDGFGTSGIYTELAHALARALDISPETVGNLLDSTFEVTMTSPELPQDTTIGFTYAHENNPLAKAHPTVSD